MVKTCFGGVMTRGDVDSRVDGEKGRGGEDDGPLWDGVDCESGGLPGKPPACFGSGLKRGETCTFILKLEGDANGNGCPCELV